MRYRIMASRLFRRAAQTSQQPPFGRSWTLKQAVLTHQLFRHATFSWPRPLQDPRLVPDEL